MYSGHRPPSGRRPPPGRRLTILPREDFSSRGNSKMMIPVPNKTSRILPRNSLEKLLIKIQYFEKIFLTKDFETLNKCENLENIKIGKHVGKGLEGDVFELNNEFVIKVGKIYNINDASKEKVIIESLISLLLAKEIKDGNSINFPTVNDVFACYDQSPYSRALKKQPDKLNIYTLMEKLDNFNKNESSEIIENLILQLFASIYFIQEKFKMVHQDLHDKNIMIKKIKNDKEHKYLNYKINGKRFRIPNIGLALIIIDFGFSTFEFKKNRYHRSDFNKIPREYNMSKTFRPNYDIAFITKSLTESKVILTDKMNEVFKTINTTSPTFNSTKRPLPIKGTFCPKELFKLIEKIYSAEEYINPGWKFSNSPWFSFSNE